ncbi:GldL-related protein [Flavobacterium rivuli]|uniref:GldL-related protein n=1 Tax=Flavobacterium rivuli TaxID=498301 RepID=UPI0014613433|nr:hypothetical protein [Flavobacterium rivuli]
MKRSVYVMGFIACFTLITGLMFKIMHWPLATVLLFAGFLLLNVGFLPTYFYQKYKAAV